MIKPGANVAALYGVCFDAPDGKVRLVMELCTHGSLRAYLKALPRDKVRPSHDQCRHCFLGRAASLRAALGTAAAVSWTYAHLFL